MLRPCRQGQCVYKNSWGSTRRCRSRQCGQSLLRYTKSRSRAECSRQEHARHQWLEQRTCKATWCSTVQLRRKEGRKDAIWAARAFAAACTDSLAHCRKQVLQLPTRHQNAARPESRLHKQQSDQKTVNWSPANAVQISTRSDTLALAHITGSRQDVRSPACRAAAGPTRWKRRGSKLPGLR